MAQQFAEPIEFLYQRDRQAEQMRFISVTYAPGYSPAKIAIIDRTVATVNRLLRLRSGWDGGRAFPISSIAATSAVVWLSRLVDDESALPQVVPLPSGGIQLEWLAAGDSLEIEVDSLGNTGVLGADSAGNVIVEGEYPDPDGTAFVVTARKHLAAISSAITTSALI